VRAALALVTRGEAAFGIVYASDATRAPQVKTLYTVPEDAHDPIVYPAAALSAKGAALLELLLRPDAQAILTQNGFEAAQ
jgi:molybdate transport system substrate-binding protein